MIRINRENVKNYLIQKGLLKENEKLEVYELSGGVSSILLKLIMGKKCWVLKQPLEKMRVKAEWTAPLWRSHREAKCIRLLSAILPKGSVPQLIFNDPDNYIIIISCSPKGAVLWKEDLMKGNVNLKVAKKAGEYLAIIQNETFKNDKIRKEFSRAPLGGLANYYRVLEKPHPDLVEEIEALINFSVNNKACLTLADFNPKNIFVKNSKIMLIDLEGAHWGDQSFDPALLITHLLLKATYNSHIKERYFDAVQTFWKTYNNKLKNKIENLEDKVVKHIGALLLARVDGKSPVKYLSKEKKKIPRTAGRKILLNHYSRIQQVIDYVDEQIKTLKS